MLNFLGNHWSCFKDDNAQDFLLSPMSGWFVKNYKRVVKDSSRAFCSRPPRLMSSNSTHVNVTLINLLEFNQTMFERCPSECHCSLNNINTPLWVTVNCSNAQLSKMPEILPNHTQAVDVSHNNVSKYFQDTSIVCIGFRYEENCMKKGLIVTKIDIKLKEIVPILI